MIDIDYSNTLNLVRANIGDPKSEYVTDGTINSALSQVGNDTDKASILVMETMLTWFATLADSEKVDQVQVDYRNLYEKYKSLLDDFKAKLSAKTRIPIIFGGTSLEEKNRVNDDLDSFRPFDLPDWERLVNRTRLDYEDEIADTRI